MLQCAVLASSLTIHQERHHIIISWTDPTDILYFCFFFSCCAMRRTTDVRLGNIYRHYRNGTIINYSPSQYPESMRDDDAQTQLLSFFWTSAALDFIGKNATVGFLSTGRLFDTRRFFPVWPSLRMPDQLFTVDCPESSLWITTPHLPASPQGYPCWVRQWSTTNGQDKLFPGPIHLHSVRGVGE